MGSTAMARAEILLSELGLFVFFFLLQLFLFVLTAHTQITNILEERDELLSGANTCATQTQIIALTPISILKAW